MSIVSAILEFLTAGFNWLMGRSKAANSPAMEKAKEAQLQQGDKDQANKDIAQAEQGGSPSDQQKALDDLRRRESE